MSKDNISQLGPISEAITNFPRQWFHTYESAKCLKCGAIEEVMVRIGVFIMCETCCNQEFPGREINKETYKLWLDTYNR